MYIVSSVFFCGLSFAIIAVFKNFKQTSEFEAVLCWNETIFAAQNVLTIISLALYISLTCLNEKVDY